MSKNIDRTTKVYILDHIDASGYRDEEPQTYADKIAFLSETFEAEYGWANKRMSKQKAVEEWLRGLPSSINIVFYNHDILDLMKTFGLLTDNPTKASEARVIHNYWRYMAGKICQLFRGSRIPPEPVKDVRAEIYDFGHDSNGNGTSHFTVWVDGSVVYKTKRRQQCGYGADRSDGALVVAQNVTGHPLRLSTYDGSRSNNSISAQFEVVA